MAEIDIYPQGYGVANMDILNLLDIFKSQKTYHFESNIPDYFWEEILPEDIKSIKSHISFDIKPKGYKSYELDIHIKANVEAYCSVCLKEFSFEIDNHDVFELLDKELESYEKSHMLKEKEFSTYYIDQENFDPSEVIIDAVLSTVPIRLLCQEGCKLEPDKKSEQKVSGFAILKELLSKEEKNGSTKT